MWNIYHFYLTELKSLDFSFNFNMLPSFSKSFLSLEMLLHYISMVIKIELISFHFIIITTIIMDISYLTQTFISSKERN